MRYRSLLLKAVPVLAGCLFVLSCSRQGRPVTTGNPHEFVSDAERVRSITTLRELDPGRLYEMDFTADYKLDELIGYGVESMEQMLAFMSGNIFDAPADSASAAAPSFGCSAYAATEASRGDFLMGRNYDFCHVERGVEIPTAALVVRTSPKGGKKSVSMTDTYWMGFHKGFYNDGMTDLSMLLAAPYAVFDGVNEDGFAICVLHLDGKATRQDEPGKRLVWSNLVMRKLLDTAGSVEEALELAGTFNVSMKTPAGGNLHFFLADATGDFAILEFSYPDAASVEGGLPNVMKVFRGRDCDRYVTNFYVDPALSGHPTLGPLGKHGLWRYDTLRVNLGKCGHTLSLEDAMGLLGKVSQDPRPGENTSHTQWSALYNLSRRSFELSILKEYDRKWTFRVGE